MQPADPERLELFALEGSTDLGQRVAREAGIELGAYQEQGFPDGELKLGPLESVDGKATCVLGSLHAEPSRSIADKLLRLLIFAGALHDAGAAQVIALTPYLAFARQDQRTASRDPITTRYLATLLQAIGITGIAALDVHDVPAFENAFSCRKWPLSAAPMFVGHFRERAAAQERVVVLAPDAGGVKRAQRVQELLEAAVQRPVQLGFMDKKRSDGGVTEEAFAGDVEGAFVLVVDDLVSGGATLARAAGACLRRGARSVQAAVTHAVLTEGAGERLRASGLASLAVTDSIPAARERCPELDDRIEVLDTSALLAEVVAGRAPRRS